MTATERRIISVLFADLVGFTALSERLDAEDVVAIQDEYFERARNAIVRHGGVVQKFIGDAVAATFGIPVARSDDAVQAVRAAWAVVAAVRGVGSSLGLAPDDVRVRVGVNTGRVVVAENEADPSGWRVTGDAINTAARFQTAADPGVVVIGQETAVQASTVFDLDEMGPLRLKGKAEPVRAWRVNNVRPTAPPRSLSHARLVGREDELGVLTEAIEGRGRPVQLVIGPPGLGKSRLLAELVQHCQAQGIACWRSDLAVDSRSPYGAIRSLLRHALPTQDAADARSRLRECLGEAGYQLDEVQVVLDHAISIGWTESLPRGEPELIHRSLLVALAALASQEVVWVFDDLHLAPPDLLALLRKERDIRTDGRTIVASARPTLLEANPFAADSANVVHLKALDGPGLDELIADFLSPAAIDLSAVEAARAAANGNPLFVEEVLRSWVLSGRLSLREGTWELVGSTVPEPPASLDAAYQGQLDDLPADARHLAEAASIVGRSFDRSALAALRAPVAALGSLMRMGLVVPQPCGTRGDECYTFRHALLRDSAYRNVTRIERGRLHHEYARWLQGQTDMESREEIALHLEAAYTETPELARTDDMAAEAADALEDAASDLMQAAPLRSSELYRRAIQLTPGFEWQPRIRRQLRLGEAERRSGRLAQALEALAEAGQRAEQANWPDMLAEAAVRHEDALFASRLPRDSHGTANHALLTSAERLLHNVPTARRACVEAARARAEVYAGDLLTAVALAKSALNTATQADDPTAIAQANYALRLAHPHPGQLTDRIRYTEALVAAAQDASNRELELEGVRHLVVDHLQAGQRTDAEAAASRAEQLIDSLRFPLYLWYPSMWRGMFALLSGPPNEATHCVEAFREEGERWGYRDTSLVYAAQLAQLHVQLGTPDKALAASDEALRVAGSRWLPITGLLAQESGDADVGREVIAALAAVDWDTDAHNLATPSRLALGMDLAVWMNDSATAAGLAHHLLPWSGQVIVLGSGAVCLGAADAYLGRVALHAGDNNKAATLLRRAAGLNQSLDAEHALQRTLKDLPRTGLAPSDPS